MLPVDKLAFFVLWSIAEIALCNTRTNNSSTTTGQGQLVFAHIVSYSVGLFGTLELTLDFLIEYFSN